VNQLEEKNGTERIGKEGTTKKQKVQAKGLSKRDVTELYYDVVADVVHMMPRFSTLLWLLVSVHRGCVLSSIPNNSNYGSGTENGVCDCDVSLLYNISTSISCSNCVIGNSTFPNSREINIQLLGSSENMSVTLTNCSFIRTKIIVEVDPQDSSTALFTLIFVDCLFEGSALTDSPVAAVNLLHGAGVFHAQFVRCEFLNNFNGGIMFDSGATNSDSWVSIDSCLFHNAGNGSTTTPTLGYDNREVQRGEGAVSGNFYSAVTLNSFGVSVYIRNSTFRGLSVQR